MKHEEVEEKFGTSENKSQEETGAFSETLEEDPTFNFETIVASKQKSVLRCPKKS